jgi:hypothetical protein
MVAIGVLEALFDILFLADFLDQHFSLFTYGGWEDGGWWRIAVGIGMIGLYLWGAGKGQIRFHGLYVTIYYILSIIYALLPYSPLSFLTIIFKYLLHFDKIALLFTITLAFQPFAFTWNRYYEVEGPYGVGYRKVVLKQGQTVGVYYPIDKEVYDL